eukprot:CAMPEP_0179116498 /NCGR_PEP_ID=MMETSP0796-20121207/54654_1 /TAXON_ID=73915 /ORGANISM="Pyrodinium bahamense, Strain pbaha01" /LENGTH=64 /DNA_ID=CAMNT_0020814797 /DNA_START=189 /DNA_END=383 /DNA_ORIENTATION=+
MAASSQSSMLSQLYPMNSATSRLHMHQSSHILDASSRQTDTMGLHDRLVRMPQPTGLLSNNLSM